MLSLCYIFHASQTYMCLGPHKRGWCRQTCFIPPVNFLTERYKSVLLLWTLSIICVSCLSFLYCATLWPDTGKGLTPGLLYVMFSCGFVSFQYGVLGKLFCLECIDS